MTATATVNGQRFVSAPVVRIGHPCDAVGLAKTCEGPAFAARDVPMGYRGRAGTGGRVLRLGVAIALSARGLKGCDVARSLLAQADLYLLASMSRRVRPLVLAP